MPFGDDDVVDDLEFFGEAFPVETVFHLENVTVFRLDLDDVDAGVTGVESVVQIGDEESAESEIDGPDVASGSDPISESREVLADTPTADEAQGRVEVLLDLARTESKVDGVVRQLDLQPVGQLVTIHTAREGPLQPEIRRDDLVAQKLGIAVN